MIERFNGVWLFFEYFFPHYSRLWERSLVFLPACPTQTDTFFDHWTYDWYVWQRKGVLFWTKWRWLVLLFFAGLLVRGWTAGFFLRRKYWVSSREPISDAGTQDYWKRRESCLFDPNEALMGKEVKNRVLDLFTHKQRNLKKKKNTHWWSAEDVVGRAWGAEGIEFTGGGGGGSGWRIFHALFRTLEKDYVFRPAADKIKDTGENYSHVRGFCFGVLFRPISLYSFSKTPFFSTFFKLPDVYRSTNGAGVKKYRQLVEKMGAGGTWIRTTFFFFFGFSFFFFSLGGKNDNLEATAKF